MLKGRKVGKGRWMAKCTVHRDKTASVSISDMGAGFTRVHCFSGCAQADVLRAAGLTWRDLRPGSVAPEIRQRMTLEDQREALKQQLGLVMVLGAIEKGKKAYWGAAERRIRDEIHKLRCAIEPEKVWQEQNEARIQQRIKKYGFDQLWRKTYGMDGATENTSRPQREVRPDSLHGAVRELPKGWVQKGQGNHQRSRGNMGRGA